MTFCVTNVTFRGTVQSRKRPVQDSNQTLFPGTHVLAQNLILLGIPLSLDRIPASELTLERVRPIPSWVRLLLGVPPSRTPPTLPLDPNTSHALGIVLKTNYQHISFFLRYSKVSLVSPLVNISASCSTVSIFNNLIPRFTICSLPHIVLLWWCLLLSWI